MTKNVLSYIFLLLVIMTSSLLAGCESPRVKTVRPDPISGKWHLDVFGPKGTKFENRKVSYDLLVELVGDRIFGTMHPHGGYRGVDSDIRGSMAGSEVEWDEYLKIGDKREDGSKVGTHAGHYKGTLAEDGETLSGEVLLGDDKMHLWSAERKD